MFFCLDYINNMYRESVLHLIINKYTVQHLVYYSLKKKKKKKNYKIEGVVLLYSILIIRNHN